MHLLQEVMKSVIHPSMYDTTKHTIYFKIKQNQLFTESQYIYVMNIIPTHIIYYIYLINVGTKMYCIWQTFLFVK